MDGIIDGYNSEEEVDEPGAIVEKVEKGEETVGQARCVETWMRWNDL